VPFYIFKLDHLNATGKYFNYLKRFTGPSPLRSAARCLFGPEATKTYWPTWPKSPHVQCVMRAHARACLRQTTVSIGAAAIVPTAPPTVRSHPLFHPRASGLISLCVLREVGFPSSPSHHSATPIGRSTVRLAVDESSLISLTQAPSQGALPPRVKLRHLVKLR
jgi:hypothetical protein